MRIKLNLALLSIVLCLTTISCKKVESQVSVPTQNSLPQEDYIYSTIISKKGEVVFEEYYNGKTKDSLCDVQSLTKGLVSILVGIAIDQKYIENVDVAVLNYFPDEFKSLTGVAKEKITIKHLLNQTDFWTRMEGALRA